jgi:hypothetical protein
MFTLILAAWSLVAITVIIHATGLALVLGPILRSTRLGDNRFWPLTWMVIRIAWWLIVIHTVEIVVWGLFYWWQNCFPDGESAFYFAGVTYATVGYGDLVLPKEWRLLGPIEGLTGILMCGLSTGLFFAIISRMYEARTKYHETSPPGNPS